MTLFAFALRIHHLNLHAEERYVVTPLTLLIADLPITSVRLSVNKRTPS